MELDKYGTASDLKELLAVRDSIEELLERRVPTDGTTPKAELRDLGDAYRLVIEVPGVAQEDLEIAVQGRELVVAGHRDSEPHGELVFSERPRGPFQRTVTLPGDVDPEHTTAQLVAGLLILRFPKA